MKKNNEKILISGLINLETNLKITKFPIEYCPVLYPFNGVNSCISGVGYNIAKALKTLGAEINFCSIIGKDIIAEIVKKQCIADNISLEYILSLLQETPQSVILYEQNRRQINVDLKDIQSTEFPTEQFNKAVKDCKIAALCNINFSRKFLKYCKDAGKIIATDVHAIECAEDSYNSDFIRHSDILFLSNERLNQTPEDLVINISRIYSSPKIIVVGLGGEGALLYVRKDKYIGRIPAENPRSVINTIGAGDALFSAFIYAYSETEDPYLSIKKAVYFAGYKIGETGASTGFLSGQEFSKIYTN